MPLTGPHVMTHFAVRSATPALHCGSVGIPPSVGFGIPEGQVTGSPVWVLVCGGGSVLPVALALSGLIHHSLEKVPVTLWFGLGWGSCHAACFDAERAKCPSQSKNVWILPSHCSLPRKHGCSGWVPVTSLTCLLGCLTPLCWPWVFSESPLWGT